MSNHSLGNVPIPLSAFIGRGYEVAEIKRLLSSNRLVTLTGAGGSGKTRLAIKVAHELLGNYRDGVWFVELSSLSEPTLALQTIASVLDVHERSNEPLMQSLIETLSRRQILLVIDNCEHIISTCAEITEVLLAGCAELSVLATSREPLNLPGEMVWAVPPLSLPEPQPWRDISSGSQAIHAYEGSEAIQLFIARAQAVHADFTLTTSNGAFVAEICRRLDGMPLAIELAAARARSLSVQQIAQRLDDRFRLLTGGARTAPPRQQTLAATLDWSYNLLSSKEQTVLQRFSVFAGGATLEAAESVCAGGDVESAEVLDALSHLVDKSLITATSLQGGETRYRLLETIRQYALEKLGESREVDESRTRHLNYFLQWAENAHPQLDKKGQLEWLERYEADHDNLRSALEWCAVDVERAEAGLRLAAACGRFWRLHGYISEGRTRLTAALSHAGAEKRSAARAWALFRTGVLAYLQGDYSACRAYLEESLAISQELGESGKLIAANSLDVLGEAYTEAGDYDRALPFFEKAMVIYRELKDRWGIGEMLMQFGWAALRVGDYDEAQARLEEVLTSGQETGYTEHVAFALGGLGELAVRQKQYERAVHFLDESLTLHQQRGDKWTIGTSLGSLGWVALRQRDYQRMKNYLSQSLAIRTEVGDKGGIAWCLEKLAEAKFEKEQLEDAARIFGHAESVRAPIGSAIDPADQPDYNRLISDLRSALGPDAFAALWTEGKTMRLEEVIELALSEPESESAHAEKEKFGGLTAREREVATLIAQGKSNREIAEAMTVGVKTIETYVTRILNKLNFDSRVQIATWAVEKGLR